MHGVRTFSTVAVAAAFQIFLILAVVDLQPAGDACLGSRETLTERLGLRDVPELYEVFGIADHPPRRAAQAPSAMPAFGCGNY